MAEFPHLLEELDLEYLPLVATYGPEFGSIWGIDIEPGATHEDTFARQYEEGLALGARQVTSHTGADSMLLPQAVAMFERALEIEASHGVPVGHETHRLRVLYSPFTWRDIRTELPDLKTVIDLSHWVNVCERLPVDVSELVESCIDRSIHAHCRVGYAEGPQVNDPRAPEHAVTVEWHESCWSRYLDVRAERGDRVTFDPEYGPTPYMQTLPYVESAVIDLHDVRSWTTSRIRQLWHELSSRP